jgi:hypothetical protein
MKEHPEVYERMIAAYVIGYSITEDYLTQNPHLKFATGPDDIGVIISYNTEAPDVAAGVNPVVWPGALVINPIHGRERKRWLLRRKVWDHGCRIQQQRNSNKYPNMLTPRLIKPKVSWCAVQPMKK